METPNCTEAQTVRDAADHVWAFATNNWTVQNGVRFGNGTGHPELRFWYSGGEIHVLGTDGLWYRADVPAGRWWRLTSTRPPCV
jgi:hypothetical protein